MTSTVEEVKKHLSSMTRDFWVTSSTDIQILDNPSPIQFMREAVCAYKPVIIRGMMDGWRARELWDMQYLLQTIPQHEVVAVNITPDGLADAVKSIPYLHDTLLNTNEPENVFTYPLSTTMPFDVFSNMMLSPELDDAVPYLSEQNDNMRLKVPALMNDIPSSIALANEVFDNPAVEAVNLWIGDERSVSSLHKDHFEVNSMLFVHNIITVIRMIVG